MSITRDQIYLAGLLHDIGKFYQRADTKLLKEYASEHEVKMKSLICPENEQGGFGYQHAWWTYKFFLDNAELFNEVKENGISAFKINLYENEGKDNLINLAIYHHKPKTDVEKLVQLADWWSSGMERTSHNMESENDIEYGRYKYKKVRLKNILSLINNGKTPTIFPLVPLDLSDNVFKERNILTDLKNQSGVEASKNYNNLWKAFNDQLTNLPTDSVKGFSESLLFLMQKFTWCIPASTNDLAHISLFEHLKTTAAIALALFDYQQETGCSYNDLKSNDDVLPLLLSCWDISGIQKFIYNVSGSKAAVSLKGRSFYLHLLMEMIKQKVLDHTNIKGFAGQVVYSSGGKMFLLLPNTDKCKRALEEIHENLEGIIWNEHKEQLYVNHGCIAFRCITNKQGGIIYEAANYNIQYGTLAELWKEVIEAAAADKYKKYRQLLNNKLSLKEHGEWSDKHDLCAVTGREGIRNQDLVKLKDTDHWVLKSVYVQIELAQALKDVDYIITYLHEDVTGSTYLNNRMQKYKDKHLQVPGSGIHQYLFDQSEIAKDTSEFRYITSADVSRVRRINDTDFQRITSLKGKRCTYGFQFYGGNLQAQIKEKERNKTFEELCWTNEEAKSEETFLGILRMDIDNLGKIFKEGIHPTMRSFAAYSTLSAQLDWFFSGYLNTLRNTSEFKHSVNIVYSGGDDVFAVGRWDKIILFAEKVRTEFKRYAGGREDISISAGISIVGQKYPIRLAAAEAGEAEDQSKDFGSTGNGIAEKNAITFFGQTISWKEEFDEVKKIKCSLKKLCERKDKPLSKALLHQLMNWKLLKDAYHREKNKASPAFRWHTAYYLKRYMDRYKDDLEVKDFLKRLQTALMCGQAMYNGYNYDTRIYDLTSLAARWAEMELKEFSNLKILHYE